MIRRTLRAMPGLRLNLAINYGGRAEIVDAIKALVEEARHGVVEIDEAAISARLYTAGLPDPDLLIRTSGEMRVSNFLLWQIAYAELYVTNTLWPGFHALRVADGDSRLPAPRPQVRWVGPPYRARRILDGAGNRSSSMKRIATALVLIPVAVWLILGAPWWVFAPALAVVGILAFREFDQIAAAQGIPKAGWPGIAAGLAVLFAPDPRVSGGGGFGLVAMALALRVGDLRKALPGAGVFLLGIVYIFGAWRCALELLGINRHWMMIAALVCWVGDTAALCVGEVRREASKLAPVVEVHKRRGRRFCRFGDRCGGRSRHLRAHYVIPGNASGLRVAGGGGGERRGASRRFVRIRVQAWGRF